MTWFFCFRAFISVGSRLINQKEIQEFNKLTFYYEINNKHLRLFDDHLVRYHEYLATDIISDSNLSWINIIRDVSLSVCEDFVLNRGDIAIINNKQGFHRRGECTILFNGNKDYQSRKLSTIRFF